MQADFVLSREFVERAVLNLAQDEKCNQLHAGSCNAKAFGQLVSGSKSMAPVYLVVHLVPLLLRWRQVRKNPWGKGRKALLGFIRSMLFVAGSLFVVRRGICLYTQFLKYNQKSAIWTGFVAGTPLLFESPGRQIEISIFVLQRTLEMVYLLLRRRAPGLYLPHGEVWLVALSTAALCYYYFQDSNHFRTLYRAALDKILSDS